MFKLKSGSVVVAALLLFAGARAACAQALYELPEGVETRWASPENPRGEKGRGAQAAGGRKGSPTIAIRAGASAVLAEAQNSSGMVGRIWMTIPDRSPQMP